MIAARLSEVPDRRVLLLEAGPDYPSLEDCPEIYAIPGFHWWRMIGVFPRPLPPGMSFLIRGESHGRLIGGKQRGRDARVAA